MIPQEAKQHLKRLSIDCPGDFVVIAHSVGGDCKISTPATYRKDALEVYNLMLEAYGSGDWVVSLEQLYF